MDPFPMPKKVTFLYLWELLTQSASSTMVYCGQTSHHRCLFYPQPVWGGGGERHNCDNSKEALEPHVNSAIR